MRQIINREWAVAHSFHIHGVKQKNVFSTVVSFLASGPSCLGSIPVFTKKFKRNFHDKSGQLPKTVDRTYLVLASSKIVLH